MINDANAVGFVPSNYVRRESLVDKAKGTIKGFAKSRPRAPDYDPVGCSSFLFVLLCLLNSTNSAFLLDWLLSALCKHVACPSVGRLTSANNAVIKRPEQTPFLCASMISSCRSRHALVTTSKMLKRTRGNVLLLTSVSPLLKPLAKTFLLFTANFLRYVTSGRGHLVK